MTENGQAPATGREGRWRRWLLVVSLGFNLLILGLVAGAVIRGGPPGAPIGGRIDLTVGPLTRALDDDDRRAIRDGLQQHRPFGPGERQAMRRDMQDMLDILRADRFDSAAFRDVVARQRGRLAAVQDAALDQLTARIEAMSPEARAAFAERLSQELRHGRDH